MPRPERRVRPERRGVGWAIAAGFVGVLGLGAAMYSYSGSTPPAEESRVEPAPGRGLGTEPAEPVASGTMVLSSVQSFYAATEDFSASFEQTYSNPVYGTKTVRRGTLRVKKPNKMVWDYTGASEPDFYVGGRELKVVEHDRRQVVTHDVGTAEFAEIRMFLMGHRDLGKRFRVRLASERLVDTYGQPGHAVVELRHKRPSADDESLLLVVDDPTGRVDGFVVRRADRSVNHFVFTDVARNRGLTDVALTFQTPEGYVEVKGE